MKKNIVRFGLVLTCLISLVAVAVGQDTPQTVSGQSGNAPQEELSTPAEAQPSASAKPVSEMKADQGGSTTKHDEPKTNPDSRQKTGSTMSLSSSDAQTLRSAIVALNQSNTKLQVAIDQLNADAETFRAGPHDAEGSKLPGWLTGVMCVLVVLILAVAGAYGFLAVISTIKKEIEGARDELKKELAADQKQGKSVPSKPAGVAQTATANPTVLAALQRQESTLGKVDKTVGGFSRNLQALLDGQQRLENKLQAANTGEIADLRNNYEKYKKQYEDEKAETFRLREKANKLEQETNDFRDHERKWNEEKRNLEGKLTSLNQEWIQSKASVEDLTKNLSVLKQDHEKLESEKRDVEALRDGLAAQLAASQTEAARLRKDLDVAEQAQQTMEKWKAGFWPQSVQDDRLLAFFQEAMAAAIGGSPEANWLVSCLNGVHLAETNDLVPYEEILHLTGGALCRYAHAAKKEEKELHEILTQLSVAFRNSEKGKATGAYCRVPTLGAAFDTAWVKSETGATRTERINNWCVMNGRGRVDRMASVG